MTSTNKSSKTKEEEKMENGPAKVSQDAVKGGDSKRQRSSTDDRQGKRRNTKGGLEKNEFCLEETVKMFLLGTGEAGVANKIVGYVQDYFRLDSLERINQSNCAGEICMELQKLVDAKVADETFVSTVLAKLVMLIEMENVFFLQLTKFLEKNGLELVTQSMTLHPSSSNVQAFGFCVLSCMTWTWRNNRKSMGGEDIDKFRSYIVSKPCMDMAVRALENHQDVPITAAAATRMISEATYSLYSPEETGRLNPRDSYQHLKDAHLQYLQQANVLPLCWSLLPKHIRHRNFLMNACNVLLLHVGGVDRPVLKKLLAETPQVDELLVKVAEVHGSQSLDASLIELRNEYNAVRGPMVPVLAQGWVEELAREWAQELVRMLAQE